MGLIEITYSLVTTVYLVVRGGGGAVGDHPRYFFYVVDYC